MSTQDKLAEALEHTARHRAATEGIDPDQWRVVLFKWEALALQAHAAEAELAEAQNTIAAQQGTMGALKRKLALAEGELAALKARMRPVARVENGEVRALMDPDDEGKYVAVLVVEE